MTEQQWWNAETVEDLENMIVLVQDKTSSRKLQLFGCACCRRIWHLFKSAPCRDAVELMERYAEGAKVRGQIKTLQKELEREAPFVSERKSCLENQVTRAAFWVLCPADSAAWGSWEAARSCAQAIDASRLDEITIKGDADERRGQAALVRDIFGNPFRPIAVDPAWSTANVTGLAQSIYTDRAFDRLLILADALEDAGCDNADILNHCRQPGEHVRGCWVVDLVLGKS
jgi:hypothetical protein